MTQVHPRPFYPIRASRGFTLVEVMVALAIFAISLLGLAALQVTALRDNHIAKQNTLAIQLLDDLAERIRANPAGVQSGAYDGITGRPAAIECYSKGCSATEIAQMDLHQWFAAVAEALPSGTGSIQAMGNRFTLTIMWDQERTGASGKGCSGDPQVDLKCLKLVMRP